jgi:uncharacterized protein
MNLFEAIEAQDVGSVARLLLHKPDLNNLRTEFPQWSLLHEAIEQLESGGSIKVLVLLLRQGAAVDIWDTNRDATPLLMALFRGQLEAVHLLLAAGADPNVVGSEGYSPLGWCVEQEDYDTAALLLHCGATQTINAAGGSSGMTALYIHRSRETVNLFEAIANHDIDSVAKLLRHKPDLNSLRAEWPEWSLLDEAINQLESGGSIKVLVLLLRQGAAVDIWDADHDSTPLLMALFRDQLEAVRLLLAAGADPNVVGSEGDSPLRWCVEQGDYDTAALLLQCGATQTINSAGGAGGMTALGLSAKRLDLRMIELLLQAGADPEAIDADKLTAYQRLPSQNEANDDVVWVTAAARLKQLPTGDFL